MFGLSKEQTSFQLTNKCPLCGAWPMIPRYFKPDGKKKSALTPIWLMEKGTVAECPKCSERWDVFATTQPKHSQQEFEISFTETHRNEEPIGEDQRLVDNSKSSINLTRRFTVSKEWSQSYTIEHEKAKTSKSQFGIEQTVNIQTLAENSIKEHYSLSQEAKQSYTGEITLDVPAKTKLRIVFTLETHLARRLPYSETYEWKQNRNPISDSYRRDFRSNIDGRSLVFLRRPCFLA